MECVTELIMFNWVELSLTELKLIKPMPSKCVHQREKICYLRFTSLPSVYALTSCSVYISGKLSAPPFLFLPLASICCFCYNTSFPGCIATPNISLWYAPTLWRTCYLYNPVSWQRCVNWEGGVFITHVCHSLGAANTFLILTVLCLLNLSSLCSSLLKNCQTPVIIAWICSRLVGLSHVEVTLQGRVNMQRPCDQQTFNCFPRRPPPHNTKHVPKWGCCMFADLLSTLWKQSLISSICSVTASSSVPQ